MLDIDFPVMLAGMGGVSYSDLVAAVSEAGGIGTLGASTMDNATLIEEMRLVREKTSKPFGVDLLTALPNAVEQNIKAVITGGARIRRCANICCWPWRSARSGRRTAQQQHLGGFNVRKSASRNFRRCKRM